MSARGTLLIDLRVRDCWLSDDWRNSGDEPFQLIAVEVVPCESPHHAEVIEITQLVGGRGAAYPGDGEIGAMARDTCIRRFEARHTISYESSQYDLLTFYPQSESWSLGDREVVCSVHPMSAATSTGRFKESDVALPGTDADLRRASSCRALAEVTAELAQLVISGLETLPDSELAGLATGSEIPAAMIRPSKRELLIATRAVELGCRGEELNEPLLSGTAELTAATPLGGEVAADYRRLGYWDPGPIR